MSACTRLALTTDSHVVDPLFFPGGDIGRLAVCGTVNDVAVLGAKPLYLTAGFILEEGLELDTLQRVLTSMREAAADARDREAEERDRIADVRDRAADDRDAVATAREDQVDAHETRINPERAITAAPPAGGGAETSG